MASITGGPADKLGNEFERLWTVYHLVEVIMGRAVSVQVEALGDDEKGTEFWVARPGGTREAHQCKRENGSRGNWTIADLQGKRIIANAKFQLSRSPEHGFVFASGDKAGSLSDLIERANRGDGPQQFFDLAVGGSSKSLRSELDNPRLSNEGISFSDRAVAHPSFHQV
jgi:hypothetical protein